MTKEIPLSLQVFHSRNEYQAQRQNRTEQIRLEDLHGVLKREERLYMKGQDLYRQQFHSHYVRQRSEPAQSGNTTSSAGIYRKNFRTGSVSSRFSVFSAPANLKTQQRLNNVDSTLSSRMYTSFGEIATMTRFQRVERKLSSTSLRDKGLLSPKGSNVFNNIESARDILFKFEKNDHVQWRKESKYDVVTYYGSTQHGGNNETTDHGDKQEKGSEYRQINSGNIVDKNAANRKGSTNNSENIDDEMDSENNRESMSPKKINININLGAILEEFNNEDRSATQEDVFSPLPNITNITIDNKPVTENNNNNNNDNNSNNKRRVTICSEINPVKFGRMLSTTPSNTDFERPNISTLDDETTRAFNEWRRKYYRQDKLRHDPLQSKVNVFLSDQTDFNRVFPKHFDGVPKTTAMQKELASIGKEKKEKELKQRRKKHEIVLEVLSKLGIEDKHIVSVYKNC